MVLKICWRKQMWTNLTHYSGMCLKKLRKTTTKNQDWSALAKIWTRDLPLTASANLLGNFLKKYNTPFRIGDEFVNTVRVRNHAAEYCHHPQRHVQKFLNSPLGVTTANVTVLDYYVPQYCYVLSQSSKFCSPNSLHCFLVGAFVTCIKCDPWFYNGWFGGNTHWCEVLLQTLEKCIRNAQRNSGDEDTDRTQISDSSSLFKHGETWAEDCCVLRSKTRSMLMIVWS